MFTTGDVASVLRCCPDTVRSAIARGELAAVRLNRRYRISGRAIDRWLAGRPALLARTIVAHDGRVPRTVVEFMDQQRRERERLNPWRERRWR